MTPLRCMPENLYGLFGMPSRNPRAKLLRRSVAGRLTYLGMWPRRLLMFESWVVFFLCLILAVASLEFLPNVPPQITSSIMTLGVFLFVTQQWLATRRENSMDKFYDRREFANRRLDSWPHAQRFVGHLWGGEFDEKAYQESMYVYIELDSLEYIVEKYRIGFLDKNHAWRGIDTFMSRCSSKDFRLRASASALLGGYTPTTQRVVQRLVALWE